MVDEANTNLEEAGVKHHETTGGALRSASQLGELSHMLVMPRPILNLVVHHTAFSRQTQCIIKSGCLGNNQQELVLPGPMSCSLLLDGGHAIVADVPGRASIKPKHQARIRTMHRRPACDLRTPRERRCSLWVRLIGPRAWTGSS